MLASLGMVAWGIIVLASLDFGLTQMAAIAESGAANERRGGRLAFATCCFSIFGDCAKTLTMTTDLPSLLHRIEILLSRFTDSARITRKDILRLNGWSDSTLRRRIARRQFPRPKCDPFNRRPYWTPDMLQEAQSDATGTDSDNVSGSN